MWLVTGATGHIGNVLVRKLLERGENVRALILPGESRESISGLKVEAFEGDILNLDAVFESMRGIKDSALIRNFVNAARAAHARATSLSLGVMQQ